MRRHCGCTRLFDPRCGRLGHLEVEVGGLHFEALAGGRQKHVRQDRNRVASFNDTVDVVQGFEEIGAFECYTHDTQGSRRKLWSEFEPETATGVQDAEAE